MSKQRYHHYIVFDLDAAFYELSNAQRTKLRDEFLAWSETVRDPIINTYSTQGYKAGAVVVFWCRSDRPEAIQEMLKSLRGTQFGRLLKITYTMFGVVRKSQYSRRQDLVEQPMAEQERLPYLIIYPFTKTAEWHQLDFDTRKGLMKEHIMVGIQHKTIRQTLLYSYGLDDHEFIVSYECSLLEEFQDLVMALRPTTARVYTKNDLPIYTGIYYPAGQLVDSL